MTATAGLNRLLPRRALTLALELALLALILGLAAHLRLANVAENPAWYTDEATHIDIARHLARGETRYMAVQDSTLLFGRVPLFHALLALLYRLQPAADSMLVSRSLTGALGVLSVALLYVAARASAGGVLALLAAAALAIYPQAVVYSRFGFSYNLLAPLVLLALLGLSRFSATRRWPWLALASVAVGLGTITDLAALALVAPFVLIVLLARRPLALAWSLPLLLLPFAVYALWMLSRAPEAFLFDLRFTLSRLSPVPTLEGQLANLAHNYVTLLNESIWFPLGLAGLFLLRPARFAQCALLLALLPVAAIGRGFALYSLSAYYLIPFLPFVALGAASLVWLAASRLYTLTRHSLRGAPAPARAGVALALSILGLVVFVGVPLLPSVQATIQAVETGFPTPVDGFLIDPDDGRAAAAYVNANAAPEDIVIVSPVIGWLMNARVADFQMTAAAAGRATPHLPADVPPERWAFPMDYHAARFVVTDNLWYSWGAVHVPGIDALLRDVETWPRAFQAGVITVYRNPAL